LAFARLGSASGITQGYGEDLYCRLGGWLEEDKG
jgi:hypothetical protein